MLPQVLEAILDDDQDMQDMYLARRAELAKMISPDPPHDPDDPAVPDLALLPSVSSSSFAEIALTQALQTVASTQGQLPDRAGYPDQLQDDQSWLLQGGPYDQGQGQGAQSQQTPPVPLDMAVPDQASLLLSEVFSSSGLAPCVVVVGNTPAFFTIVIRPR